MKKRLIITNASIIFLSLCITLIISCIIIMHTDERNSSKQAKGYLRLACEEYDGTNGEELIERMKLVDEDIRITIIDLDGKVIIDSSQDYLVDSHLNRKEIQNLGEVCIRYSSTLKRNMLYVAMQDGNEYVRVAFPTSTIHVASTTFLVIGTISLVITTVFSSFLSLYFIKKSLFPVNNMVNDLAHLTDSSANFDNTTIDDLPKILELLRLSINEKLHLISNQRQQLLDVLDHIQNGLMVIDNQKRITLINPIASTIFHSTPEFVQSKDYIYLIRDVGLQKAIEQAFEKKESLTYVLVLDSQSYLVYITYAASSWLKDGLIIMLQDITESLNLERTKREFFANASHELKSPLTSIIGYQQLITEGIETDSNKILEYSKKILKEAYRMNDIIIDMLNLAKLERREPITKEKIQLDRLILDIIDSLQPKITEKELQIQTDLESTFLMAEKNHIYEIVRNLLDNAIKYNKKMGTIKIVANEDYLSISDTGIGIAKENQARIFERFYRVDKAKSKVLGGTGLGLAIVKHICELYNYRIVLTSKINEGTTIIIYFKDIK